MNVVTMKLETQNNKQRLFSNKTRKTLFVLVYMYMCTFELAILDVKGVFDSNEAYGIPYKKLSS